MSHARTTAFKHNGLALLLLAVSTLIWADIPQDAQQAANNARRTTLLVRMAREAHARGDHLACAAFAREAERIATLTDILKQQVEAEYALLPAAQQRQVFTDKESVIADATITRQHADSIRGCLDRVRAAAVILMVFLLLLLWWLFWRAFGPFRLREE